MCVQNFCRFMYMVRCCLSAVFIHSLPLCSGMQMILPFRSPESRVSAQSYQFKLEASSTSLTAIFIALSFLQFRLSSSSDDDNIRNRGSFSYIILSPSLGYGHFSQIDDFLRLGEHFKRKGPTFIFILLPKILFTPIPNISTLFSYSI
jgi:hypothetical protein